MEDLLRAWSETKQLVSITTLRYKSGRSVIMGRILQYNPEQNDLLVYDDDRKVIHHLTFTEIDDIQPAS
jgi:hypothetical protein